MTTGYVTEDRQVRVPIRLKAADGAELTLDAVLDTGFSDYLTLPSVIVEQLDLPRGDTILAVLADGTRRWCDEHEGRIFWNGVWRAIPIQVADCDPLFGMGLIFGNFVTIEAVSGGSVTIDPVE